MTARPTAISKRRDANAEASAIGHHPSIDNGSTTRFQADLTEVGDLNSPININNPHSFEFQQPARFQ
jgi:hypothetical protein